MIKLVTLREILEDTRKKSYAVPHFNVFNIEMLEGVLDAAQALNSPVIVAYGEGFRELLKKEDFPAMVRTVASHYSVPVCIHLDHSFQYEWIEKAVCSGYTSVMLDVSDKSFEENIRLTKKAVELCRPLGIAVESELGHVSGLGTAVSNDEEIYTEVETACLFVEQTGIDALAVSIGTVHGPYLTTPRLNIGRLEEIAEKIKIPLVLHGGSGLTDEQFKTCIQKGISKVNIHTDLALAASRAIKGNGEEGYLALCTHVREAVAAEAEKKIMLFGSQGMA